MPKNESDETKPTGAQTFLRSMRDRLLLQEDFNFLLTNRIPRRFATIAMGWFSRIESPFLTRISLAIWKLFADLDLSEAKETRFKSLHACFTRELRPGTRPVDSDPSVLVSPCDGIVGACGKVEVDTVYQTKGFPYHTADLFGSAAAAAPFRDGCYVTLRLTSAMYHRFHAPADARITQVTYLSGDTWNVNPIALKRVERLFCKNERASIGLQLPGGQPVALVAVAAILVASIRLRFLDILLHLRWKGPDMIPCDAAVKRGDELGWFEHGSTILLFAPAGFGLHPSISTGTRVRMGQPIMQLPARLGAKSGHRHQHEELTACRPRR